MTAINRTWPANVADHFAYNQATAPLPCGASRLLNCESCYAHRVQVQYLAEKFNAVELRDLHKWATSPDIARLYVDALVVLSEFGDEHAANYLAQPVTV